VGLARASPIHDWPHFHRRGSIIQPAGGDRGGALDAFAVDNTIAAELLLGLHEWPIRNGWHAVVHPNSLGEQRVGQWSPTNPLPGLGELLDKRRGLPIFLLSSSSDITPCSLGCRRSAACTSCRHSLWLWRLQSVPLIRYIEASGEFLTSMRRSCLTNAPMCGRDFCRFRKTWFSEISIYRRSLAGYRPETRSATSCLSLPT
jgi:hypothetical protein